MPNKKFTKKTSAARDDSSQKILEKTQSELRRAKYIRALRSKPISLVVGPSETAFDVPEGLLRRYSLHFETMLSQPFKESTERLVQLPEVEVTIFEEFLIWIYALHPFIAPETNMDTLIGLAVFADLYFINTLKNQLSDALRGILHENPGKLTPENTQAAYRGTYTNSTLRQLCSCAFTLSSSKGELRRHGSLEIWRPVFTEFADFGWDYFQILMDYRLVDLTRAFESEFRIQEASIMAGGSCRFHDHSDILGWKRTDVSTCPHPHGAALELSDASEFKHESASTPAGLSEITLGKSLSMVPHNVESNETTMTVDTLEAGNVEEPLWV